MHGPLNVKIERFLCSIGSESEGDELCQKKHYMVLVRVEKHRHENLCCERTVL